MSSHIGEILNKIGVASIGTNVGLAAWFSSKTDEVKAVASVWQLADTAIVVSICVSIMWIIKLKIDSSKSKLERQRIALEIEILNLKKKELEKDE